MTLRTFPVPAYAHVLRVISAYLPLLWSTVLTASNMTSALSCLPRYSNPRPRQRNLRAVLVKNEDKGRKVEVVR